MLNTFARIVLKLSGWTLDIRLPPDKKFIIVGAPHTSNWDFPLALLAFWTLERKVYWIGKIQMFRGPLKYLFTALGGIPVDRSAPHGYINKIADRFNDCESMALAIAPEGTRARTEYWKSGFYYIARAARVPVCLGYINYRTRTLGARQTIYPTGDIESDIKLIADFYSNITGKYPQKQGPVRLRKRDR